MNLKTNPEGVKNAFRVLEHQDMETSEGWGDWLNFLNLEQGDMPKEIIEEMRDGIVASVYGQGGWSRYQVIGNGDVFFSEMHADTMAIEEARKAGFPIG